MCADGLRLRSAAASDVPVVAAMFRHVRTVSLPFLPVLRTPEEDLAFFRDVVFRQSTLVIAELDRPVGFVAWRPRWVDHLYVHPEYGRRGIGSLLLRQAIAGQDSVSLWVFGRNTAALEFYRRHGFQIAEETDGHDNEEKEPDVRLVRERDQSSGE